MGNNWFFMDFNGGDPYILPTEFFLARSLGDHLFSQSSYPYVPGSLALQGAFNCISKFTGAFLFWFTSGSSSNLSRRIAGNQHGSKIGSYKSSAQVKQITSTGHNLTGFHLSSNSESEYACPVVFNKVSSSAIRRLFREGGKLHLSSVLSLAAAVIPPLDNVSSKVLAVPLDNAEIQMHESMGRSPCEVESHRCGALSFPDLSRTRHAVEPRTGIEFPMILDNVIDGENYSSSTSEVKNIVMDEAENCAASFCVILILHIFLLLGVLVGTGSRTIKIVKIKSLKVYAFAFYVHPRSVCEKLGPKYASISVAELNKCGGFYEDLLREDIDMTVRLVINCNGMKVNAVKDVFEKSLRARLEKANPNTDYHCLESFGSYFSKDIPLPLGTVINFRRTAAGQLITERAFFDMYIGTAPVSEQTKEEIGKNVATPTIQVCCKLCKGVVGINNQ
ncbi:Fatty-acid-binding protein 2 [Citrus sinensis]|uniref:Fatty-acid-binding protein 2 n=1 Tax=Citrus sinensis TaxID=2711 RepID=A0ACB8P4F4_CITSI|nr:Fatty-acid-binding protein 2 [Citrus sinensis]